jgi:hypothetical protein
LPGPVSAAAFEEVIMYRLNLLSCLLAAALLVASCGEPPVFEAECGAVSPVFGEITRGIQSDAVGADLIVSGTAVHPNGLAIRNIAVGGIQAENSGFNFDRWTVTLPFDQLQALAALNAEGNTATIDVSAVDVCNIESDLGSFEIDVDDSPGIEVASLAIGVVIPGDENHIPVGGDVPALLTIEANPEAAGASVLLTSSAGTFQGVEEGGAVTLVGDGLNPAAATVFFSASEPGVAVITAASEGQLAQTFVSVAGAPSFIPASGSLSSGQSISVAGLTDGRFATCSATPSEAFEVRADDVDLVRQPQDFIDNGDGRVDVVITAADEVLESDEVTVICVDVYGQANSATFTIEGEL